MWQCNDVIALNLRAEIVAYELEILTAGYLFKLCFWSDIKNHKVILLLKAQCFLHINTAYLQQ